MKIRKLAAALATAALVGSLAACASGESPSSSESGGGAEYESVTLSINTGVPPTHHLNQNVFLPWKEYVEEATDGAVTVELYDANTLGSLTTVISDLESGLYDMGVVVPTFFLDSPLFSLTVGNLLGAAPDQGVGSEIVTDYLSELGGDLDVQGVEIVGASVTTLYEFWSKTPLASVDDIKGLQVRVGSAIEGQVVSLLGGIPVQVPPAESYQALERATVEAAYFPAETALGFKLYEVAPNLFESNLATTVISLATRSAFLDGLSEPLRELFDTDLLPKAVELLQGSYAKVAVENTDAIEELESAGDLTVTQIADADSATVAAAAEEQWAQWIADADSKGFDGQALADQWLGLMDAAGVERPY